MIILRLCPLLVLLPDSKQSGLKVIDRGMYDHTGSSTDYFIFGSPGHSMVLFMVLLIPAYISVWLGH